MADEPEYSYWAFICNSQSDRPWADWLHASIQDYDLSSGNFGNRAPDRISPVFLTPGIMDDASELGDEMVEHLYLARYLIVLCSPHGAMSTWCNDAVRFFKYIGREDKIIHVVVSGEPFATDNGGVQFECFGDASRFRVNPEGQVTDEAVEVNFVEARTGKSDKENALAEIVERIIGGGGTVAPKAAAPSKKPMVSAGMVDDSDDEAIERILDGSSKRAPKRSKVLPVITALSMMTVMALGALSGYLFVGKQESDVKIEKTEGELSAVNKRVVNVERERDTLSKKLKKSLDTQRKLEKRSVDAELQRDRNKVLLDKALKAIDGISDEIMKEEAASGDGGLRDNLLKKTFGYYKEFLDDAKGNSDLAYELGNAQKRMGFFYWKNGNLDKAVSILKTEIKKEEKLLAGDSRNKAYMKSLSQSNFFLGKIYAQQKQASRANEHMDKAAELLKKVVGGSTNPADMEMLSAIYKDQSEVLSANNMVRQSADVVTEQLGLLEKLLRKNPSDDKLMTDTAEGYLKLGKINVSRGDVQAAANALKSSMKYFDRLSKKDPTASEPLVKLSEVYDLAADAYLQLNDNASAISILNKNRSALKKLSAFNPESTDYVVRLADAHAKLGDAYNAQGDYEKADDAYANGLPFIESLVVKEPSVSRYQNSLAKLYSHAAKNYSDKGNFQSAVVSYQNAENVFSSLATRNPENTNHHKNAIDASREVVKVLLASGNAESAVDAQLKLVSAYEKLLEVKPGDFETAFEKTKVMDSIASNYEGLNRSEESLAWHKKSLEEKTELKKIGLANKDLGPAISESLDHIRRMEGAVRDQLLTKLDNSGAASSVAGTVHQASDKDAISAKIGRVVTVTGVVDSVSDQAQKYVLNFRDAGNDGFHAMIPETRYEHFKAAYGDNLSRIIGKSIAVTGNIERQMGRPYIAVNQFDQLQIVAGGAAPVAKAAPARKSITPKSPSTYSKPKAPTPRTSSPPPPVVKKSRPVPPPVPSVASKSIPKPKAPSAPKPRIPSAPKPPSPKTASNSFKPAAPKLKPKAPSVPSRTGSLSSSSIPVAPSPVPASRKAPTVSGSGSLMPLPPAPRVGSGSSAPKPKVPSAPKPSAPKAPSPADYYKSKPSTPSYTASTPTTRKAPSSSPRSSTTESYSGLTPVPELVDYSGQSEDVIFASDNQTIKAADGKSITVEGRVRDVITQDDLVALTFWGSSLTPVIVKEDLDSTFKNKYRGSFLDNVKGKMLRVNGLIYLDQGVPRMSVDNPESVIIMQ